MKLYKKPKKAIKGKVVADFFIEVQGFEADEKLSVHAPSIVEWYNFYTDDAAHYKGSGIGAVPNAPSGLVFGVSARLEATLTNNETEYEAIIHGMDISWEIGVPNLRIHMDSAIIMIIKTWPRSKT